MTNNVPCPTDEPCSVNPHFECTLYTKFINFGWEHLYQKYMSNFIRIIKDHSTICRLCLLKTLDESSNVLATTLLMLQTQQHCKTQNAIQLENNLKDIFPNADPVYLELVGEMYAFDENGLSELIEQVTTRNKSYPKLQDYNIRMKLLSTIDSLKENFQVKEFLSMCPDPVNYFNNVKVNDVNYHYVESMAYLSNK